MGKSYFAEADEAQGGLRKSLTGALVEIVSFERQKTGPTSQTPGARMYMLETKIVEPKKYKGLGLREWIVVGTADDLNAKKPETWNRAEAGPGRLKRVLVRSGTPLSDDDEEWMEAAEGKQYVTPVNVKFDGEYYKARPGLAYRPTDEDCPDIGEASGEPVNTGAPKAKGATAAAKALRSATPKVKVKEVEVEDDEDEKPATTPTKTVMAAKDDDDDEDDDD